MNELLFKTPNDTEFLIICNLIKKYELDNRELSREEFTIIIQKEQPIAFGRLKKHTDCVELCSIGVLASMRNKGVGILLINHMINKASKSIYLVCIIPEYFNRFGFKITHQYPLSIKHKINYCKKELSVPEVYVAMVL